MAYSAEISRVNPTCFLFLVDHSGSMAEPWGSNTSVMKAQGVADAVNRLLYALVDRCSKGPQLIYDYYSIGVIGYGAEITLGFSTDGLSGTVVQPVSQIGQYPLRIEQRRRKVSDGAGGLVEEVFEFPLWFDPVAYGQTPMCQAMQTAGDVVAQFVREHPQCFPPVVFNITDGAATDGDPAPLAAALQDIASADGNVLLFNIHISRQCANPIFLPDNEVGLPDEDAWRLFQMSSLLPAKMLQIARVEEIVVAEGARGFAFNADVVSLVRLINIGTQLRPAGA